MILSSPELWSKERKMTKPIRIRSINEYLEVSVNLELLPSASSMLFCSELEIGNFLKFWSVQSKRRKKRLIVSLNDIRDGRDLKTYLFLKMRYVGTSLGWTVVRSVSPEKQ